MAYTRRHGIIRILVRVMCIASIPYQKDIMFMDEGYKLTIELEDLAPLPKEDDDMPQAPNDHDGENGGGNKDVKHSDDRDGQNKKILDEKEVSSSKSKTGVILTCHIFYGLFCG
jgi:hypothetical protein